MVESADFGRFGTTLFFIEAGSALDCSEKMSCDRFGNLILRPTSFPMHNWLHLIALASILYFFLPTFSPTQKLDLLQTFFTEILRSLLPFKFLFDLEKSPQKIDVLKAIAFQMTACMHICCAICNTSVFLLCISICYNR